MENEVASYSEQTIHFTQNVLPFINDRESLLNRNLRPNFSEFSIIDEYPLVLGSESNNYGFGLFSMEKNRQKKLVAHANLWPRDVFHNGLNSGVKVGLIGNVVTDEEFRGRGLMRKLLENISSISMRTDSKFLFYESQFLTNLQLLAGSCFLALCGSF